MGKLSIGIYQENDLSCCDRTKLHYHLLMMTSCPHEVFRYVAIERRGTQTHLHLSRVIKAL